MTKKDDWKKQHYTKLITEVEDIVEKEIPAFKNLIPFRKFQQLAMNVRYCSEGKRSVKHYTRLFNKGGGYYDRYEAEKLESEYLQLLSSTRLIRQLQACDEYDLKRYVIHLKSKLEQGLLEPDIKKRFNLYDYICAGCLHCKVDNEEIMAEIADIRERANEIIREIPTM